MKERFSLRDTNVQEFMNTVESSEIPLVSDFEILEGTEQSSSKQWAASLGEWELVEDSSAPEIAKRKRRKRIKKKKKNIVQSGTCPKIPNAFTNMLSNAAKNPSGPFALLYNAYEKGSSIQFRYKLLQGGIEYGIAEKVLGFDKHFNLILYNVTLFRKHFEGFVKEKHLVASSKKNRKRAKFTSVEQQQQHMFIRGDSIIHVQTI